MRATDEEYAGGHAGPGAGNTGSSRGWFVAEDSKVSTHLVSVLRVEKGMPPSFSRLLFVISCTLTPIRGIIFPFG